MNERQNFYNERHNKLTEIALADGSARDNVVFVLASSGIVLSATALLNSKGVHFIHLLLLFISWTFLFLSITTALIGYLIARMRLRMMRAVLRLITHATFNI